MQTNLPNPNNNPDAVDPTFAQFLKLILTFIIGFIIGAVIS